MKLRIYQVDAFTDTVFSGNPAAVCPLDSWPADNLLQKIAMENNLSETAFYVKHNDAYPIRWFTPTVEVDLCGHATLAAAFVLFNYENHRSENIHFCSSRSGKLTVRKSDNLLLMNFPADVIESVPVTDQMHCCFNISPKEVVKGLSDYLFVYDDEESIRRLVPDFGNIMKLNCRGVIVSAKGYETDFVSRFFAPRVGVPEDPVTGSAHTTLIPYWASKLSKDRLTALQLSQRSGQLYCRHLGNRVEIGGAARLYLKGEIYTE
jgi:PhzF family phenazine biosynthesis protein